MTEIFGIPIQALMGQLMLGLVNGSFYAMLSLGLAVIFGMLNIINFAHGALYMMGAILAWIGLNHWATGGRCCWRPSSWVPSASSSSGPCCAGFTSWTISTACC